MTPTQRAALVEDLEALIARHGERPTVVPYESSYSDSASVKDAMIIEANAAIIRLAEAVLVLLPDADREDV